MRNHLAVLLAISCLAFGLRIINISNNPPALSWDEVSIGYNAYSILKTARDEHGRFMPLDAFAAYGDYKPPVSIYITVPFVAIFGLRELAVRLPSAIFGSLTVLLTYFTVAEIFRKDPLEEISDNSFKKYRHDTFPTREIGLLAFLSALLLAVSPWHINISRAGFEANIALFFVMLGVNLFLRARKLIRLWLVAWIPFVFAVYTFNSSRYFVFFMVAILFGIFWKTYKVKLRYILAGLLLAGFFTIPILPHLVSKEARLRFAEVNIFSDPAVVITSNERIQRERGSLLAKIIHNRRIGYAREYLTHFLDNLQPDFLFIKGDGNPKFSTQDVGQLYMIEAPFLVIGVIGMFMVYPKVALFLLLWLVAAILPAAAARETPHALRILNSFPTWHIFIAFGLLIFFRKANRMWLQAVLDPTVMSVVKRSYVVILSFGVFTAYNFQFTYYLYNYHIHYPRTYASEWQYGYKQALEYIKQIYSSYDHIYITDRIGRPYMYVLFYTSYEPSKFQKYNNSYFDAAGFFHVDSFDKYVFTGSLPDLLPSNSLVIGDPHWTKSGDKVLRKITFPSGSDALIVFERS